MLDIGCGRNKLPGAVGLDVVPLDTVDVVHDLNVFPYPFADNTFDTIRAIHVIEHMKSVVKTMEELHRIAKSNAIVTIVTPHYTDSSSWQDPTHLWHLNSGSFSFFEEGHQSNYYSKARFHVKRAHVKLLKIHAVLGIEWLVNLQNRRFRFIRKFWEQHLCYIVRGKVMEFELVAIKDEP
jgi:predicted SAM-dependent methyltransferase